MTKPVTGEPAAVSLATAPSSPITPQVGLAPGLTTSSVVAARRRSVVLNKTEDDSLDLSRIPVGERLEKSIVNFMNGGKGSIERLAFEVDPNYEGIHQNTWVQKLRGLPDTILKRISIQDHLVAAIVNARANHIGQFGRRRRDRFSIGFAIEPRQGVMDDLSDEEQERLQERIDRATKRLETCGSESGYDEKQRMSFAQYLTVSAKNAVILGRTATEIVWARSESGEDIFHSFRPIDAGTIYRAVENSDSAKALRRQAKTLLERMARHPLQAEDPREIEAEDIAWVQVVEGTARQSFTNQEVVCFNFYPVADIEYRGYPVTPLDTAISAVTTHINITTHNKLYFQTGRAARGILVIKSDDMDDQTIADIRQQFNAAINSVQNSWRVPILGIATDEAIEWQSTDGSQRDMEFQYLADMTARIVLSAFQMSPEELPGYAHLSRGTTNQALCLSLESRILTPSGQHRLGDLLGEADEVHVQVWTGLAFEDARVFKTTPKTKASTTLSNGVTLVTSPDHRYRVIGDAGEPEWRVQADLQPGDTALVNRRPVPGTSSVPSYQGRPLTIEMMEALGWLTGDGTFSVRTQKKTGKIKQMALKWYFHHDKERDVWARYQRTLSDFGLNPKPHRREVTEAEKEKLQADYGFKEIADERLSIDLFDTDFCRWLLSLGFQPSRDGKVVPALLHSLPIEYRQAFLRGLFSADATLGTRGAPRIVIHSDVLRDQVRQLLLGLGIRTSLHQGLRKRVIEGRERRWATGGSSLQIKDKHAFWDRIGMIQGHKQPTSVMLADEPTYDGVSPKTAMAFARQILDTGYRAESRSALGNLQQVATGKRGCSLAYLKRHLKAAGLEVPTWMDDFFFEEVIALERSEDVIEMADVEVFDSTHAFVADGIVVHNSESNKEYQLTAARDVGIRPLIANFEDFLNHWIMPLIDKEVAEKCELRLLGLDAQTAEKESIRIQQDAPLHGTMNSVLEAVEKPPVPKEMGGDFPFNQQFQAIIDKFLTVGQIMEYFFGVKDASKRPELAYIRDAFWFQFQQLQDQRQQMQMQQQMAQQQAQAQGQQGGGGGGQPTGDGGGAQDSGERASAEASAQSAQDENSQAATQAQGELTSGLDQARDALGKSESQLSAQQRHVLAQHTAMMDRFRRDWVDESKGALREIVRAVTSEGDGEA